MAVSDPVLEQLCRQAGLDPSDVSEEMGPQGGNNTISLLRTPAGGMILKRYVVEAGAGGAGRLDREWGFVSVAASAGLDNVPAPVARSADGSMAIFTLIEGTKPEAATIGPQDVVAAADFLASLNAPGMRALGAGLPDAAEACFSLAEHLRMLEFRLGRLPSKTSDSAADRLIDSLRRAAAEIRPGLEAAWRLTGLPADTVLPVESRCLSPSDFGFHNAIRRRDGALSFIDFEYAGWDDPAKMLCDAFLQPAISLDRVGFDAFARRALAWNPEPAPVIERSRRFFPCFALKWCCIILNPFVPEWVEERSGTVLRENVEELRQSRLARADYLRRRLYLN